MLTFIYCAALTTPIAILIKFLKNERYIVIPGAEFNFLNISIRPETLRNPNAEENNSMPLTDDTTERSLSNLPN